MFVCLRVFVYAHVFCMQVLGCILMECVTDIDCAIVPRKACLETWQINVANLSTRE